MKAGIGIIGVIVVVLVIFFGVPMAAGGSTNVCQALEKHNVSQTAQNITGTSNGPVHNLINSVGQSFATGEGEQQKQAAEHPNTPSVVSCAAAYWKTL